MLINAQIVAITLSTASIAAYATRQWVKGKIEHKFSEELQKQRQVHELQLAEVTLSAKAKSDEVFARLKADLDWRAQRKKDALDLRSLRMRHEAETEKLINESLSARRMEAFQPTIASMRKMMRIIRTLRHALEIYSAESPSPHVHAERAQRILGLFSDLSDTHSLFEKVFDNARGLLTLRKSADLKFAGAILTFLNNNEFDPSKVKVSLIDEERYQALYDHDVSFMVDMMYGRFLEETTGTDRLPTNRHQ